MGAIPRTKSYGQRGREKYVLITSLDWYEGRKADPKGIIETPSNDDALENANNCVVRSRAKYLLSAIHVNNDA